MKQAHRLLAGLICGLALITNCSESTSPQMTGIVIIDSTPSGAAIWLDNANTGKLTPTAFEAFAAGQHQLQLVLQGYQPWQGLVFFKAGQDTTINVTLVGLPGTLQVSSNPTGAFIFLDGDSTGSLTPATLDSPLQGTHELRLLLPGYFPAETTIVVNAGQTKNVMLPLDPAPSYKLAYSVRDTIYVVGLDGLNPVPYAHNCDCTWGGLRWSPNGQFLSYLSEEGVSILNQEGVFLTEIPVSHEILLGEYSWSHSSDELAIVQWCGGVYVYNLRTGKMDHIYNTLGCGLNSPAFSPNDSVICYFSHGTTSAHLRLLNRNGSNNCYASTSTLTAFDERLYPSWISDTEILFRANGSQAYGVHYFNLADTNSSGLVVSRRVVATNGNINDFAVSPDRQYYAYTGDYSKLYYGRVNSWLPTELRNEKWMDDSQLSWSPNGEAIAFRTTKSGIWWVLLDGTAYHIIAYDWRSASFRFRGSLSVTQ